MLDIKLIRENPKLVENNLKKRGNKENIKMLRELIISDKKRRETIRSVEKLKHRRNNLTREIAKLKAEKKDASKKLNEVKKIIEKIKELDTELRKLNEKCNFILMRLPNMLHESVPIGKDDSENVEIRRWGRPPKFDFTPNNHIDILQNLGLIDEERAAKVSGKGFFYLRNQLVMLDYAILKYAVDFLVKKGYALIEPPFMIRKKPRICR